jgi:hypothetical protein
VAKQKKKATDVSSELWGGIFQSDNRGFYTSLEFMALMSTVTDADVAAPADCVSGRFSVTAPGHVYARRFAFDPGLRLSGDDAFGAAVAQFVVPELIDLTKELLQGLRVQIPGQGKDRTNWSGSHFVPYGRGLAHWDARTKRTRRRGTTTETDIKERIYYRGAGSFAFKLICADPDTKRAEETLTALRALLQKPHFLGSILDVFHLYDTKKSKEATADTSVMAASRSTPDDRWSELLRSAVHRVVTNDGVPGVVRLDALFRIIPLCLIVLQIGRSAAYLADGVPREVRVPLVVDCTPRTGRTNEVRQTAHRSFDRSQRMVEEALALQAQALKVPLSSRAKTQFRSWFTRGAPAIGLLNAASGIRRFVLSTELLEALVIAAGPGEMTFESFVHDWLYLEFGFVVDDRAARTEGLDVNTDMSVFEDNAAHLATTLACSGLLQSYSDSTRMVRYGY